MSPSEEIKFWKDIAKQRTQEAQALREALEQWLRIYDGRAMMGSALYNTAKQARAALGKGDKK
jgi:hypothetical protein